MTKKEIKNLDKQFNTNVCSGGGGNFSCRHPKLWSYIKSNVKAFFITGAITFVVSASATTILHSRQVRYKNDKSVEQVINELYQKAEQCYGYHVGDEITVAGEQYYVIVDSPAVQDYVVALKERFLTYNEVTSYSDVGQSVTDRDGNGYTVYYSGDDCSSSNTTGCLFAYDTSNVKRIIDNWSIDKFTNNELKEVDGNKARIIKYDEYQGLSSYEWRSYVNTYYWAYSSSDV